MMQRIFTLLFVTVLVTAFGWSHQVFAQSDDEFEPDDASGGDDEFEPDDGSGGEGEEGDEFEPDDASKEGDLEADLAEADKQPEQAKITLTSNRKSWQDILVVVRKPFLKVNRYEFLPMWGVTMNDNIIQHYQFGGQVNYYLTDVLSVGGEGFVYVKNMREPFDLIARQARRLPTVNEYQYSAAINFHYVPVYGKFAILDKHIIHWETAFTLGVGATGSKVIPRDPALQPFSNTLITPNFGASMRFFLTKFITVNAGIRDYLFLDQFEAVDRTEVSGDVAQENASSVFINNVMFQVGISFWFPTSFEYTTFR